VHLHDSFCTNEVLFGSKIFFEVLDKYYDFAKTLVSKAHGCLDTTNFVVFKTMILSKP
jgi:hypothetical protein